MNLSKNHGRADGDGGKEPERYDERDYRLAAAALLVHTAAIDGNIADVERERLHDVIKQHFNLDDEATDELIAKATVADEQAIDLYPLHQQAQPLARHRARARLVEMMWQVVYADGVVTEFEDNLIWRAADLLHVSREERIALKNTVAAQYDNKDDTADERACVPSRSSPARRPASASRWRGCSRGTVTSWRWWRGARTGSMRWPMKSPRPGGRVRS